MIKLFKSVSLLTACLFLSFTSGLVANCNDQCEENQVCKKHGNLYPSRFVGVYVRTDVVNQEASMPIITLNEGGTAIVYLGEALISYVTQGTISPTYGQWKYLGNGQVLVMTIGFEALDTPEEQFFHGVRNTYIIDFSQSLEFPVLTARSSVTIPVPPTSEFLNKNGGTVSFNGAITPRQLQRVKAFKFDLTRPSPI